MKNEFLARILWRETLIFMGQRIFTASLVIIFFLLLGGNYTAQDIIFAPIIAIIMAFIALGLALLSQIRIPFAGFLSYVFSIPFYLGDPFLWLAKKMNPSLVPVDKVGFVNPAFVFVLRD